MRARRLSAALLFLLLSLHGVAVSSKELEGFGDESDEDFNDEGDDLPTVTIPRRQPSEAADDVNRFAGTGSVSSNDESASRSAGAVETGTSDPSMKQRATEAEAKAVFHDDWDEDEFEGLPSHQGLASGFGSFEEAAPRIPQASSTKQAPQGKASVQVPRKPLTLKDHIPELAFLVFLVVFGINYFIGSRSNESIALAWAEQFASEGSIFEKNFSLLGPGESNAASEPLMIKEGQHTFKFYASGRRHCECAIVTLSLKGRHDLLALAWNLVFPADDVMKVEVHMNDDAMPPFIVSVTRRKMAKSFLKEHQDLKELCAISDFSSKKKWPADDLAVITDCREAANDLLNDIILDELLGDKAYHKFAAEHFISMHFTDQYPAVLKRKILTFTFSLPPCGRMGDLTRLIASIPYFIDSVAKISLSPNAKAKAEAARSKAQQVAMKELQEQRLEEIQRRREERRRAEEARMSPAELARRKEKDRLKDLKPRARLARIH